MRIYTKSINGHQVERNDLQEYPNKPFADAVKEKGTNRDALGGSSAGFDKDGH